MNLIKSTSLSTASDPATECAETRRSARVIGCQGIIRAIQTQDADQPQERGARCEIGTVRTITAVQGTSRTGAVFSTSMAHKKPRIEGWHRAQSRRGNSYCISERKFQHGAKEYRRIRRLIEMEKR